MPNPNIMTLKTKKMTLKNKILTLKTQKIGQKLDKNWTVLTSKTKKLLSSSPKTTDPSVTIIQLQLMLHSCIIHVIKSIIWPIVALIYLK